MTTYTKRDAGARLAASPTLGPVYSHYMRALEGKVEECGCGGECVEALDAGPSMFCTAILSIVGRVSEYEEQVAEFVSPYLPGDITCTIGHC